MARRSLPGPATIPAVRGSEPAAFVPPAPSKAQRDRSWEKSQRSGDMVQINYRHIPRELRDEISAIAERKGVTTDEIARAFLEYALSAYQAGVLQLHPKPKTGRFTLFGE